MEATKKKSNLVIIVGAVAVIGIAGYMLNQKYQWFGSSTLTSSSTTTATVASSSKMQAARRPSSAAPAARRGKLPWAVGDVNLWDDENPNYCGNCAKWCDSSFSEGHSTQCDMCQSQCPGVRKD